MQFETHVKVALYRHFAETGRRPTPETVAEQVGDKVENVLAAYRNLQIQRVLVLEADGSSIRMAPPFSGVPTQHLVDVDGREYFANCAWDAMGIPAALGKTAVIRSRCEQSGESLTLKVGLRGPEPSTWLFHSLVPAARWWDDIVFT